jgi:HEAT repeat protein
MKKTKPNKRWPILSGMALLIVVVLAMIWHQRPASDESEVRVSNPSPVGLTWRVGTAQQYKVQFDSSMLMNSLGASGAQAMRVQMNCLLDLRTLDVGDESALVGMRLSAIELQVNGNSDPETNRALTAPFRVRYASGGIPEAFEFPTGVTAFHRSMLKNLVRTFQVTMAEGRTWIVQESNASGSYAAAYRRTTPRRVEKTKSHFRGSPKASMLAGAKIVSTEDVLLDPQRDWIAAMTVDETLRTKGQAGLAMKIENYATLELQSRTQAVPPDTWRFVAAAAPPLTETEKPIPRISPPQAHRQILAALPELDAATEGRTTWIHRLRDLLRVDASLPAMLLEKMKTERISDRTSADLYLALELAGTESAQAALVSVIEDTNWSARDAMRAIVALAGVTQPSPDTIAALWDVVESAPPSEDRQQLVSTATLALGSLGNAMRASNDPEYPILRERLVSGALSGTGSDFYAEERTNYVHALGNTGDASLASEVATFLDDGAPAVRRAAALSLGNLGTDQVAGELMSSFNQESSSAVRGAIAESLVAWTTPSASAMASIGASVRAEPDENTRYNMARFLGANLKNFPENRAILQQLLRTEPSKRIRQNVAETLAAASR